MGKRRRPIKWRLIRRTKQGRKVEEAEIVKWSSAKSGLAKWFVRHRVAEKVGKLDPKRYSYTFEIDFRFQFPGRRVHGGTLDITPDPRHIRRRMSPDVFIGTKGFRKGLNIGGWLIYREVIRSLMLGNRGQLPSYTKTLGRKKGFRTYRKLELRIRVIRTQRRKGKR